MGHSLWVSQVLYALLSLWFYAQELALSSDWNRRNRVLIRNQRTVSSLNIFNLVKQAIINSRIITYDSKLLYAFDPAIKRFENEKSNDWFWILFNHSNHISYLAHWIQCSKEEGSIERTSNSANIWLNPFEGQMKMEQQLFQDNKRHRNIYQLLHNQLKKDRLMI